MAAKARPHASMAARAAGVEDEGNGATGRRLTPKALATRARLVELAGEVFATEGYAAASVRDIARRSGLSSGAIYGTFKGKAELLAAAVDAAIAADLETLPDDVRGRSLPEIDAYQFDTSNNPPRARLRALLIEAAVAARTDPEVRDRLATTINDRIASWTRFHDDWRAQHRRKAANTRAFVTLFIATDLGLGVLEALGADLPEPDAWAAALRKLLGS
jgi:AcrR family transcriptional regulator